MIQNADGTVSFEDVTTYSQIGDSFGAADINSTNEKVNEVNSNLSEKQNKLKLLWTNPNPTSDFAAQTLSIDLSNYDGVVIESARNDNSYFTRTAIQKGYRSHLSIVWAQATGFGADARPCRVEEASIVFDDASAYEYNGIGHGIASNTMQIPLKIYGYVN